MVAQNSAKDESFQTRSEIINTSCEDYQSLILEVNTFQTEPMLMVAKLEEFIRNRYIFCLIYIWSINFIKKKIITMLWTKCL